MNAEPKTPKPATGWFRHPPTDCGLAQACTHHPDQRSTRLPRGRTVIFLRRRFDAESASGEALENYRRRIVEQFFPSTGFGSSSWAKRERPFAIIAKPRATSPARYLLLTYMENGTEFTQHSATSTRPITTALIVERACRTAPGGGTGVLPRVRRSVGPRRSNWPIT